jgi:hypothetical protein
LDASPENSSRHESVAHEKREPMTASQLPSFETFM